MTSQHTAPIYRDAIPTDANETQRETLTQFTAQTLMWLAPLNKSLRCDLTLDMDHDGDLIAHLIAHDGGAAKVRIGRDGVMYSTTTGKVVRNVFAVDDSPQGPPR